MQDIYIPSEKIDALTLALHDHCRKVVAETQSTDIVVSLSDFKCFCRNNNIHLSDNDIYKVLFWNVAKLYSTSVTTALTPKGEIEIMNVHKLHISDAKGSITLAMTDFWLDK